MSSSYYEEEAVSQEDADVPFEVTEEVEVEDLSEQQGGVLPKASRVLFTIKKASVRQTDDKSTRQWMVKKLALDLQIGPEGTDENGTSKNQHVFPELILKFNLKDFPDKYNSDWWKNKSRYPTKMFLKAMEIESKGLKVNDDFLAGLVGRPVIADIKVKPRQEKVNGKYVNIDGEFENSIENWRMAPSE